MHTDTLFFDQSLPFVAALMGDKFGVEVVFSGSSACTDGNRIVLPAIDTSSFEFDRLSARRKAFLHIKDLYRGYVAHESGHVRYTDFDVLRSANLDKLTKAFENRIEDVRIELRLGNLYAGCKQILSRLQDILMAENCESGGYSDPTSALMDYVLLKLRLQVLKQNVLKKSLIAAQKAMTEMFPARFVQDLDVILSRAASANSTQDSVNRAREIVALLKQEQNKKEQQKNEQPPNPQEDDSENDSDRNPDHGDSDDNSDETSQDKETSEEESEGKSNSGTSDDGEDSEAEGASINGGQEDRGEVTSAGGTEPGESQPSSEENESESIPTSSMGGSQEPNIDEILNPENWDNIPKSTGEILQDMLSEAGGESKLVNASPAKEKAYSNELFELDEKRVERETSALRGRLNALLQASRLKRSHNQRRGRRMDNKRLYRAGVGDSRVFHRETERKDVNTAIHLLLDSSSSMKRRMKTAEDSVLAFGMALKGNPKYSLGLSAFPGADEFSPIIRQGETFHNRIGIPPSGGTPLAEGIWGVLPQLMSCRENRKILLVVTDGMPNNPKAAKMAIDDSRKAGVEVYGLGIVTSEISMKSLFEDRFKVITEISEMPDAIFGLLESILI